MNNNRLDKKIGVGAKYVSGPITWSIQYELLFRDQLKATLTNADNKDKPMMIKNNNEQIISLSVAYCF